MPRYAPLLLISLVLFACGGEDEQAAAAPELAGTSWVLAGGIDVPGWEQVAPSAGFADGKLTGANGCNRYSTSYTLDGEALKLGDVATTNMACGEPGAAVETAFMDALGRVAAARITDGELTLLDGDGGEVLRFREASPLGTWEVTSFLQGDGVSSLVEGSRITATFAEGGKLSGSAGCNDYTGTYTLGAGELKITDVSATELACEIPAGVMEQEQAFLAALPRTAGYTLAGRSLTLLTEAGTIVATLDASG